MTPSGKAAGRSRGRSKKAAAVPSEESQEDEEEVEESEEEEAPKPTKGRGRAKAPTAAEVKRSLDDFVNDFSQHFCWLAWHDIIDDQLSLKKINIHRCLNRHQREGEEVQDQATRHHRHWQLLQVQESQGLFSRLKWMKDRHKLTVPSKSCLSRSGRSNSPRIDYKTGKPAAASTQVRPKSIFEFDQ